MQQLNPDGGARVAPVVGPKGSSTMVVAIILLWCGVAFLCGYVASEKGRSFGGWAFLGFFFTIFALIALVAVPTLEKRVPDPDCSRCGRARVKHYRQIDSKTIYFCPSCVQEYDSEKTLARSG